MFLHSQYITTNSKLLHKHSFFSHYLTPIKCIVKLNIIKGNERVFQILTFNVIISIFQFQLLIPLLFSFTAIFAVTSQHLSPQFSPFQLHFTCSPFFSFFRLPLSLCAFSLSSHTLFSYYHSACLHSLFSVFPPLYHLSLCDSLIPISSTSVL